MAEVIRVFTPIKRVPTMIGKAQNGQKIPFGPYTLPQVAAGVGLVVVTSVAAMSIPGNPAVTFIIGLVLTVIVVFALGLVPYTGVRLLSRIIWFGRLILIRKPVSASGMPVSPDSARYSVYIEDSVVVILPDADGVSRPEPRGALASGILELAAGRTGDPTRDAR
ncbi:hypothetical protein [Nocardia mangyaensis]|uniref:hypothetical protein n=1 Tax=Nocardia mangyaensis TaxID=2213200 RepID=UPI002675C724|nr:hypothetical protein [Nocardia mangyaensis]MDO3648250.1 hypothetical protein [Nocardia mangyaensis]